MENGKLTKCYKIITKILRKCYKKRGRKGTKNQMFCWFLQIFGCRNVKKGLKIRFSVEKAYTKVFDL